MPGSRSIPASAPSSVKLWMLPIPCFGRILLIGRLMRVEPVSWGEARRRRRPLFALAARRCDRDAPPFGG